MKSEWKVSSNPIGGKTLYGVFRIRDTNAVNHSGNRENYGEYLESKQEAEEIAAQLNIKEEEQC